MIPTFRVLLPRSSIFRPFVLTHSETIYWILSINAALGIAGLSLVLSPICYVVFKFLQRRKKRDLPPVPEAIDAVILGTIHEEKEESPLDRGQGNRNFKSPEWLKIGAKALTGNLLITGVIGSGKTQLLLRLLSQIFQNFKLRPAMLAIDPKRTFVRELRSILESLLDPSLIDWVSLGGKFKMNPVWKPGLLRNSQFITVANTLKLASINFIGSSGDSRFWEQASFNLLKNSLIFCAAQFDYFTFRELYLALIEARDGNVVEKLIDSLQQKEWSHEERFNIESSIDYFKNEFVRMDEKVRTSILATATGFLSEFLEYRVSQILSPSQEDITCHSIADSIQEGRIILLHIDNDALARSIGTLLKLLFQEAVLDRVNRPEQDRSRYALLAIDELQDVVTSGGGAGLGDDRYLAKARESRGATIAATQSVSSLENAIRSEPATREYLQNFRSRIFGNSTDPHTIRLFQEPRGMEHKERNSRSYSENAVNPIRDLIFGGFDAEKSSLSESVTTQWILEHAVTAKDFARLRIFEAYVQIFDGVDTHFHKLYLKPHFLKDVRTPHAKVLEQIRKTVSSGAIIFGVFLSSLFTSDPAHALDILFPNACSVVKTDSFNSCLEYSVGSPVSCMCGFPIPRPCASVTWYYPAIFVEVTPKPYDSFFNQHPGAKIQLTVPAVNPLKPALSKPRDFCFDDDSGLYAFHAHSISVPMAPELFLPLPGGPTRFEKPCFDLMSEDLGDNWISDRVDMLGPQYLVGAAFPAACYAAASIASLAGRSALPSIGPDVGGCSNPIASKLPAYPPTHREACNGWGQFLPRNAFYKGSSRTLAALMIASRLKSLGTEVTHTIPGAVDEKWQMIYPSTSSCFKEGENPGFVETVRGAHEASRLTAGKLKEAYLFLVWQKVNACVDWPVGMAGKVTTLGMSLACKIVPGGGV
ncbi:unnamed protein product [Sphagnum tenellum]